MDRMSCFVKELESLLDDGVVSCSGSGILPTTSIVIAALIVCRLIFHNVILLYILAVFSDG